MLHRRLPIAHRCGIQTTLSYAAIFGIQEDLNLHGTQYSWLSSVFYFGFLAWAFVSLDLLGTLMAHANVGLADQFSYATLAYR